MIGTLVEPFAGDIEVKDGGLFAGFEAVVKVYHRRVHEEPSVAFTHQRYVVPYERPDIVQYFVLP